jgi:hypothetical protein
MVSGIATAYWVRWMLVTDDPDANVIHLARGAPRRWYSTSPTSEPFGIQAAPTRFGTVSYSISSSAAVDRARSLASAGVNGNGDVSGSTSCLVRGSVKFTPWAGVAMATTAAPLLLTVKIRAAEGGPPLQGLVTVEGAGVQLVGWHAGNETAVMRLSGSLEETAFNFTAK